MAAVIYIDGANLDHGILDDGIFVTYKSFGQWLRDKYKTDKLKLFLGYMASEEPQYAALRSAGYTLVFKKVTSVRGVVKGNCDAHLILEAAEDLFVTGLKSAVLVSSDGDFEPLVQFWKRKNVHSTIISPRMKCSYLLRACNVDFLYLTQIVEKIRNHSETIEKKETPDGD
jgi:uncharacterized LabA/DUF88 family protein